MEVLILEEPEKMIMSYALVSFVSVIISSRWLLCQYRKFRRGSMGMFYLSILSYINEELKYAGKTWSCKYIFRHKIESAS